MNIKMKVKQHTESIIEKSAKRYKIIKSKISEIKNEIDKIEHYIKQNIYTVENFISKFRRFYKSELTKYSSKYKRLRKHIKRA